MTPSTAESEETRPTDAEVARVGQAALHAWLEHGAEDGAWMHVGRAALEAAAALHPPREGAGAEERELLERYREALVVARAELARWGWGDFHWGEQPQEQSVTDALAVIDAALGEEAENGG